MAGSDHTACCQYVQGVLLLILVRSTPQQVLKRRSKRGASCLPSLLRRYRSFSHPEYSTEIFIEPARTLALRTAGEESFSLWPHIPAKHELIFMASAEGAGVAV